LADLFRQSVVGRRAGYERVNDVERLRHDLALRWNAGDKAALNAAASPSQMGRFETRWLNANKNLSALTDLSGLERGVDDDRQKETHQDRRSPGSWPGPTPGQTIRRRFRLANIAKALLVWAERGVYPANAVFRLAGSRQACHFYQGLPAKGCSSPAPTKPTTKQTAQ
jgi:hypothetical protein